MHLIASLVPPAEALESARALAAGVPPIAERPGDATEAGRHSAGSGRLFGRRREKEQPPQGPMLDLRPVHGMQINLARFGNVSLGDATRLGDEMEALAREWATPRLYVDGAVALEPEGNDKVWLNLAGDLDELAAVARGVVQSAQALQLFVDRRRFRPQIELGTITPLTTTAYLEALVAKLDGFRSPPWWQSTISLLIPGDPQYGQPPFKVHREIELGPAGSG